MRKSNLKPLVLSALSALALGAVGAGATFALFTSESQATINATAGKIALNAAIDDFKVYSAKANEQGTLIDENGAKYVHEEQSLVSEGKHYFANAGYASYSNETHAIQLQNLTPGDKLAFSLDFANQSNVKFLYRVTYRALNENYGLVKGLVTGIGGESYAGLAAYQSDWTAADPTDSIDSLDFTIEMPIAKGNTYQQKTANILIGVEAVQANAYVSSAKSVSLVEEDIVATAQAVASAPVVLQATAENTNIETTATLPADTVPAEAIVAYKVADLGVTDNEFDVTASMDFDIDFTVNGEPAGTAQNPFANPVSVTFDIGTGKTVRSISHNGVEMDPADYSYDPATGIVTITSTHFSPFSVDYVNAIEVKTDAEIRAALLTDFPKIALGADIVSSSVHEFHRSVNIIGNGHAIKGSANRVIRISEPNLVIDLRELGVISTCTATSDVRGISFDNASAGSKLSMYGCTVSASFYAINLIPGADNVEVTFEKGTVAAGWAAINSYSNNGTFVVKDSVLRGLNDKSEGSWNNFNTITFDGNCLYSTDFGSHGSNNTLTITNSTIYASSESDNRQNWIGIQYGALGNEVIVDGASRIINDQNEDMSGVLLLGWYGNYSGGNWSYYENDSSITIGSTKITIEVDTGSGNAEYVIEELE